MTIIKDTLHSNDAGTMGIIKLEIGRRKLTIYYEGDFIQDLKKDTVSYDKITLSDRTVQSDFSITLSPQGKLVMNSSGPIVAMSDEQIENIISDLSQTKAEILELKSFIKDTFLV